MATTRGPIPKRSEERRRANKPEVPITKISPSAEAPTIVWPEADEDWHPLIRDWYESLKASPMAQNFVQTDVSEARIRAEVGHRMLHGAGTHAGVGVSGQLFAAWLASVAELGTTEGARRRLRIELQRGEADDAPQREIMGKYRAGLKVLSS